MTSFAPEIDAGWGRQEPTWPDRGDRPHGPDRHDGCWLGLRLAAARRFERLAPLGTPGDPLRAVFPLLRLRMVRATIAESEEQV